MKTIAAISSGLLMVLLSSPITASEAGEGKLMVWREALENTIVADFPKSARIHESTPTPEETVAAKFAALSQHLSESGQTGVPIFLSPSAAAQMVPKIPAKPNVRVIGDHIMALPLGECIRYMCMKFGLSFEVTEVGLLIRAKEK
jgi:hypothetical protein